MDFKTISNQINGLRIFLLKKLTKSRFATQIKNQCNALGFMYEIDTVKSVILTLAASERVISVEEAVALSRLEEEFQISHWGYVEWSHQLAKYDLQSRMAAAILISLPVDQK